MASKTGDDVGAPTVKGSVAPGAGNTITIHFIVTPDWPNGGKIGIGQGLENGKFGPTKFDTTMQFIKPTEYKDLSDLAQCFEITSEDTENSHASRVSFWTKGGSTEQKQVAFFIIEPGLEITTFGKGGMQWYPVLK
jgi:hypothetical protein